MENNNVLLYTALTGADEPGNVLIKQSIVSTAVALLAKLYMSLLTKAVLILTEIALIMKYAYKSWRIADEATGETVVIGKPAVETKPHN